MSDILFSMMQNHVTLLYINLLLFAYRVTVENVPCGAEGLACTKSVKIFIYDTVIQLVRGTNPLVTQNTESASAVQAEYTITNAGLFTYVKTPYGTCATAAFKSGDAAQVF